MLPLHQPESGEITRMLKAWNAGDSSALEQLAPVVYAELYRLARRHFWAEREGHLLQPSALVNEAFLRLTSGAPQDCANRAQFFAVSARLMRQILIDFARAQTTGKRGGRGPHLAISGVYNLRDQGPDPGAFIDLDIALSELAKLDARPAQVVELKYFGGLENAEIADVLNVSEATVAREWRVARAWLYDRLQDTRAQSEISEIQP